MIFFSLTAWKQIQQHLCKKAFEQTGKKNPDIYKVLIFAGVLYLKIMRKWNIKVQQLEIKHIHAHFKNSCNPENKNPKSNIVMGQSSLKHM